MDSKEKTEKIVQGIQSLVLSMRKDDGFGSSFLDIVNDITEIVDDIVFYTRKSLEINCGVAENIKNDGEAIIQ